MERRDVAILPKAQETDVDGRGAQQVAVSPALPVGAGGIALHVVDSARADDVRDVFFQPAAKKSQDARPACRCIHT
jgi:hypothetical protein